MSVNKVQLANGETIIDISDSTVTPETLAEGVTAHDASGQKITGKMVPGGNKTVQTDWNQTDETAPDFLKNKPFGDTLVEVLPLGTVEFTFDDDMGMYSIRVPLASPIKPGDILTVTWESTEYSCEATGLFGMIGFGNITGEEGLEPFFGTVSDGTLVVVDVYATDNVTRNISITHAVKKKISADYLPMSTAFYNNNEDEYIYTDANCTTKATAEEVMAAMPNFVISILGTITYTPVLVIDGIYVTVGYISFRANDTGTRAFLYTAEYTPET